MLLLLADPRKATLYRGHDPPHQLGGHPGACHSLSGPQLPHLPGIPFCGQVRDSKDKCYDKLDGELYFYKY